MCLITLSSTVFTPFTEAQTIKSLAFSYNKTNEMPKFFKFIFSRQGNCPKQVEFYSKNKFEKLVPLVGFIIRIYHNARSSECQLSILSIERFYEFHMNCGISGNYFH
jgi:hypothetical protein